MSDSNSDCHHILGLHKGASAKDAKAAYRRLAKRFHPDAPEGDEARFHAIAQAHAKLSQQRPAPMPQDRRSLVSGFWKIAKAEPAPPPKAQNGAHIEAILHLSLEDALKGAARRVTLPGGRALDVNCPMGCSHNDIIRLKAAGQEGQNGGKAGDALITIKLLSHNRATLKGRDLHIPLWLDQTQLRSGGKIEAATPHGPLKVHIPPLSSHGQSLRLKDMGIPARHDKAAGHLYFTLKSRRATSFSDALSRFSRLWAHPVRGPAQPEA